MELCITTFGGLNIQQDGNPVGGFISRKVEALFVYLACNPREHSREVLSNLLWENLPQQRALGNLRTALASLQPLAAYLTITRQSLAMNPDVPYWLDAAELDRALTVGETYWQQRERFSPAVVEQLDAALKLYTDRFLLGFHLRDAIDFEDWVIAEQDRFHYRVMDCLYRLGLNTLRSGSFNAGVAYATQLVQLDPLREDAHRLLMRLLAKDDQRSAALVQFETCRRLLEDELGIEPDPETIALYEKIHQRSVTKTVPVLSAHNLPASTTTFFGRSDELIEIGGLLTKRECRLLTLTGLCGVGKTRLAVEAARQHATEFADGVCFVDSTDYENVSLIDAVALSLHLPAQGAGYALVDVINHLKGKEILLLLDGVENWQNEMDLLSALLAKLPSLKIMLTMRTRLGLPEEWLFPVEPLPLSSATQLFAESAHRTCRIFDPTPQIDAIQRICCLVGGLPLGIELAAAWTHLMGCAELADYIERDFDFLKTACRYMPKRQRSLRGAFEQMLVALSDSEQDALFRLCELPKQFDLPAVMAANISLSDLGALVEKSLVGVMSAGSYSVPVLLRRFLLEKAQDKLPG